MANKASTAPGLTRTICEYATNVQYEDLPPAVVSVAERLILDSLGTALAGSTLGDTCRELVVMVRSAGGTPESTVLGTGVKVSAPMAALANGGMVHALNYDAIGADGGHPGSFALTSPLAVAERVSQVSGREFISALVVGVEVEMRAVIGLLRAGVDTKGVFLEGQLLSYLGATLSAGRVLKLTPNQMDSALGLMLMQTSGSRQVVIYGDPPAKAIYAAFPNQGGVMSALLAKEGLQAQCAAMEGEAGLFSMYYQGNYDPDALESGLGTEFHTLRTAFKPWATSGLVHPFIEAALQLREEHDLPLDAIDKVHLMGHPQTRNWFEPVEERHSPTSAASAANSVAFGTAKALINGAVTLTDFTAEGMVQPEVLLLTQRMDHSFDETLDHRTGIVEITTVAGSTYTKRVKTALGQPDNPMSNDQLREKFRDCASHSAVPVSNAAVEEAIDMIAHLEQVPDVSALPALLGTR